MESLTFYMIRPFVLDFFRQVVETVCLVIFPMMSLRKDQASSLNKKGVKAVVLGPESCDTIAFEGTKSVRCQVCFEYRSRI